MRLDPKTDALPDARRDLAADTELVRAATATAAAAADAVGQTSPSVVGPWLDDIVEFGDATHDMGPALSLMGHYAADESVATTGFGRARDAALRAGVDRSVDVGLDSAMESAGRTGQSMGLVSAGLGLADAVTEDTSAGGIAVDMARSVDPGTQIAAGAYALIDGVAIAANVLRGDLETATAQGDYMQSQALNGEYGSAGQGLSLAVGMAAGDPVVHSAATDRAAEQGDRGVMPMIGNYIGDTWADVVGHQVPETVGRVVDADAYDRTTRFASVFGL